MKGTERKSSSRRMLIRMLAVVLVLGAVLSAGTGMAQLNQQVQTIQDLARRFVDSGYAVVGPAGVVAMNEDAVTLRNPFKDTTLSLRGQSVAVVDANGQAVSSNSVRTGTNVYVCTRGQETVVILAQ